MEVIVKKALNLADAKRKIQVTRFFKCGKGEYGEGDIFIGLANPQCRLIAKEFRNFELYNFEPLLTHEIHELRLIALIMLQNYSKKNPKNAFEVYLKNIKGVNNWDLVDLSAPTLVGEYLLKEKLDPLVHLKEFIENSSLWKRRIAMISMFPFIRNSMFFEPLSIATLLLEDKEDLIHKAIGWMLREVGKKDEIVLKEFLIEKYKNIPRTTLRYAIEKFKEDERLMYLKGTF